jgi:predicted secreted protein
MQKRALFAALMMSLAIFQLAAGDIAVFENLGFSEDSQYLLFAQYGIGAEDNRAYAELFAVDMAKNSFLPGGVLKKVYNEKLYPGQNGSGALYMALRDFAPTIGKYKFNHLSTGRLVYLLVNGAEPQKRLEFRDFQRGDSFVVDLVQNSYGEKESLASSFHISVSITDSSGATRNYKVGHPEIKRRGVIEYRIKRAFFSPDEKGLVFVIERDEQDGDGNNIRYMVETLRW